MSHLQFKKGLSHPGGCWTLQKPKQYCYYMVNTQAQCLGQTNHTALFPLLWSLSKQQKTATTWFQAVWGFFFFLYCSQVWVINNAGKRRGSFTRVSSTLFAQFTHCLHLMSLIKSSLCLLIMKLCLLRKKHVGMHTKCIQYIKVKNLFAAACIFHFSKHWFDSFSESELRNNPPCGYNLRGTFEMPVCLLCLLIIDSVLFHWPEVLCHS